MKSSALLYDFFMLFPLQSIGMVHEMPEKTITGTLESWSTRRPLLILFWSVVTLASLLLAARSRPDSEVVRHFAIAEMMQKERVLESRISIASVRFGDQDSATVEAHVLQVATKGTEPAENVIVRFKREEGRWRVEGTDSPRMTAGDQ